MRYLMLAFVLLVVGCDSPFDVDVESQRPATADEIRFAESVYSDVAECLGVRSYHRSARYWIADRVTNHDKAISGAQVKDNIFIAGDDLRQRYILSHEIIHHALWRNTGSSDPDHRDPAWNVCARHF